MLDRLEALALEGAAVSNDAVLDLVVDLLLARLGTMRRTSREACSELLLVIMRRASFEARAAAATRLAEAPATPSPLLLALAREAVDVAAPVLQNARGLLASDLLLLLSEASPAHLRLIARRDGLSEAMTDLIALRGDREAILLVLLNRRARLSRPTLIGLADKARGDLALRGALIQRSDLSESVIERLWPLLDAGDRARLLGAGWRYNRAEVDEVRREAAAALMATIREGAIPQSIDSYATLITAGQLSRCDAVSELVETGRLVEATQLIARTAGLNEGVVLNLVYGVYDRGLAILARGAALDEGTVTRLVCARARLPAIPIGDIRRTLKVFGEATQAEAAEILETLAAFWAIGVTEGGSPHARRRLSDA